MKDKELRDIVIPITESYWKDNQRIKSLEYTANKLEDKIDMLERYLNVKTQSKCYIKGEEICPKK